MRCTLSIIIPIYNVEAYLTQCLESIAAQAGAGTDIRTEVILVDDGSTDHSGEIADRYDAGYPWVRVIHKKNAGVAAARNDGMDAAHGEWLYFMDSDDWMSKDGITLLLDAAEDCPQADMILLDAWQDVGGRERPWEHFAGEDRWESREELLKLQRGVLYYPMDFPKTRVSLAAPWDKLYRREFLNRNQIRFRETLQVLDDMIFNMEVLGKAKRAAYKKYKVCHYRHVPSSITNRFRADRADQDGRVWKMIEEYRLTQFADGENWEKQMQVQAFDQAFFGRIIRSFAICCRLCFYHRDNRKSYREKQKYVRDVVARYPYREAFLRVRTENLEWKLRAVVCLIRHDFYGGLFLLHLAEQILQRWLSRRKNEEWRKQWRPRRRQVQR